MAPSPAVTTLHTSLLVIGAGPYGVATAACARALGIDTVVVGRPMAFWRDHMPAGMFLRSEPDWHLDAAEVHTFAAFLEHRGLAAADVDPVPIGVFLDYAAWFVAQKGLEVRDDQVTRLAPAGEGFAADLAGGGRLVAERVVAATGIARFQRWPEWARRLPPGVATHTCDAVDFAALRGARLLIVGGRQSAYEWAALAADHGAERIDVVHRHPTPRFAKVSWRFVDDYAERTIAQDGWWRRLPADERQAIGRRFWEVGRLTLEPWLPARLPEARVIRHPDTDVSHVAVANGTGVTATLTSGTALAVDRVILATGYEPNLANLPYLSAVVERIQVAGGFPMLDEGFQSTLPGLHFTGFAATRDFGPFLGFTKGCPAAATVLVRGLVNRA